MNNNTQKLLPLCISALILAGCSGGDGYSTTNVPPDMAEVSGAGVKGPLVNATVNAYQPDYTQENLQGALLGSGTTNASAAIEGLIIDANYTGPMVLEFVVGADTVDLSSGAAPAFDRLVTYVTKTQRQQVDSLYASILTTMAVDLALANTDASVTQEDFEAALVDAQAQVKDSLGFGLPDFVNIFTTPPLLTEDTTSEDAMSAVLAYRQTNELVAAVALKLNEQSSTSQSAGDMLMALVEDLTDGDLDGESSAGAIGTLQTFTEDFATTIANIDVTELTIPGTDTLIADLEALVASEAGDMGLNIDTTALEDGTLDIEVTTLDGDDPTPERRFDLYTDSLAEGFDIGTYNPESAVTLSEEAVDGRGMVFTMDKAGSVGNSFFTSTNGSIDMSSWSAIGELAMDIRVNSMADGVDLLVKMDSGWPNVSDTTVTLGAVGEWFEFRINVADLVANGNSIEPGMVDLLAVVNAVVFEPTGVMNVSFDNVRFVENEDTSNSGGDSSSDDGSDDGTDTGSDGGTDSGSDDGSDTGSDDGSDDGTTTVTTVTKSDDWTLVWSDEFDGTEIDSTKWEHETNCWGGGNGEQQCYTDRAENSYVADGYLNMVAIRENFTGNNGPDGVSGVDVTLPYTSARLRTKGKQEWTYGRFEVRAKMPAGQGTWPAAWMLPTDSPYGGWASGGEIDIVETVNLGVDGERYLYGTIHYGGAWPDNVKTGEPYQLPDGANPKDNFHTYAVEWEEGAIRWYVDDIHYATAESDGWYSQYMENGELVNGPMGAPFDAAQQFHLLLNFAVGGSWAGNTNRGGVDETAFPATMQVDWVRVYECSISPNTGAGCAAEHPDIEVSQGNVAPDLSGVETVGQPPLFEMFIDETAEGLEIGSYNPDGAVTITEIADSDANHGQVLNVNKTGNTGNAFFTFSGGAVDMSAWAPYGEIALDVKINSKDDNSSLLLKVDSGWPNVSDINIPVDTVGEWFEFKIGVAELAARANSIDPSGSVNLNSVLNAIVFEPTGVMDVSFDNVRYQEVDEPTGDDSDAAFGQPPLFTTFADALAQGLEIGSYNPDGAVTLSVEPAEGQGDVFRMTKTGATGNAFFTATDGGIDMTEWLEGGELVMDIYIHNNDDNSSLMVKMDSGWPNVSDATVTLGNVGEWFEYRISVADLADNGNSFDANGIVNIASVVNPVVFEPQGPMDVSFDNIRFEMTGDSTGSDNGDGTVDDGTDTSTLAQPPLYTAYAEGLGEGLGLDSYNPGSFVTLSVANEEGRGEVLTMDKNGADGNAYFNFTDGAVDMSSWGTSGDLVMDIRVNSLAEGSNLLVKIDSGWPNVSDTTVTLGNTGEWFEFRINVADLADNGNSIDTSGTVNLSAVTNPVVFEPTGVMNVSFDNVRFEQN